MSERDDLQRLALLHGIDADQPTATLREELERRGIDLDGVEAEPQYG
jgi:hypothetical protein